MNKKVLFGLCIFLLALAPAHAWDDSNYGYRKAINTSGSTNTDYQVSFNWTYSPYQQADMDDFKCYSDGGVLLNHWIESKADSEWAYIWLKMDTTTTSTIKSYCYYGNGSAASLSDIDTTMFFGDNFDDGSLNTTKWDDTWLTTGTITEAGGILTLDTGNNYLSLGAKTQYTAGQYVMEARMKMAEQDGTYFGLDERSADGTTSGSLDNAFFQNDGGTKSYVNSLEAVITSESRTTTLSTDYQTLKMVWTPASVKYYNNNVLKKTISTNVPVDALGTIFLAKNTGSDIWVDWVFYRKYNATEPTAIIGAEENQTGNTPPIITLNNPANTTYYTTSIPVNVTISDTDSPAFWCAIYNDGALLSNETTNTTYTTTLTKTGGSYNVSVHCSDYTDTSDDDVNYYVWMGLNVSVFNNETNASMTDWDIYITNGTVNYSNSTLNNPSIFEWDTLPTGSTNITISDGSSSLYFYNSTYERTLNNSAIVQLNASLQEKSDNPITLTSSLGWSLLESQTTTINCSAPEGSTTFKINSVSISSPYTLTVGAGSYSSICDVYAETTNYKPTNKSNSLLVNPLISCTSNSTFAFSKTITTTTNITTLNFTTPVIQNLVRENLGDVYIVNATATWVNTTGGYHIIVNNTGMSSFVVYFGNYYVNNSHSTTAVTGDVVVIEDYTQINPYTEYNVLDEMTGTPLFPPNATLTSIIHCSSGETYIPIEDNETKFIIASSEYIDKASLRVAYTADAYYSRQFYPSASDVVILNFYVTDAFVNPLDRIDFIMVDISHYSELLQIYKEIQSEAVIITEGYFDISHSFSAYLLEDVDYLIRSRDSNGAYTEFGRITIVAPATKELGQITMNLNPQATLIADNLLMNAWTDDARTTLYVVYNDDTNQTEELNITIYFENGTVFQAVNYVSTNSVNLEYNISNYSNQSFTVEFLIDHETFGNSPVSFSIGVFPTIAFDIGLSSLGYQLFSLLSLILVGGLVTRKSIVGGSVVLFMMVATYYSIGWLAIPAVGVVFIALLLILGIITYIKQGGQ